MWFNWNSGGRECQGPGRTQGRLGLGLTTLPLDTADTLGIEYLRAQKDRPLGLDSLHLAVSSLQDSLPALERANREAWLGGCIAAYGAHQDQYVAQLWRPRISAGSSLALIAAAGAGFVLGQVTHE